MLTRLAEDLDEEVRAAVDDARMILEMRHGIDHAEQFHHPLHPGEIAERAMHDGKQVDARQPCMLVGPVDADVTADLAGMEMTIQLPRSLTR